MDSRRRSYVHIDPFNYPGNKKQQRGGQHRARVKPIWAQTLVRSMGFTAQGAPLMRRVASSGGEPSARALDTAIAKMPPDEAVLFALGWHHASSRPDYPCLG